MILRILFVTVLLAHGLIHLLWLAKEFGAGARGQMDANVLVGMSVTSKIVSMLWLLTCLMFLVAAIFFLIWKDWYWVPAAIAVLISQILIIFYWQDAKYGTLVNAAISVVLIFAAAAMQFNTTSKKDVKRIISKAPHALITILEPDIRHLPVPVQKWVRQSGIIGKPATNVIHLSQEGEMRTTPEGKWMPFTAEQFFTINPPAFVWNAQINPGTIMTVAGRDKYENGMGNMRIMPLYIYTAADGKGSEIDQGTLLRFLAEMAWFPQGAISEYLHWEPVDETHAKVTMHYGHVTASGIYSFDDHGNVTGFEAQRFGDFGGQYKKEKWSVAVVGYKQFNGVKIGNTSEVTWKLKEGDFLWLKMEVTDVEYLH